MPQGGRKVNGCILPRIVLLYFYISLNTQYNNWMYFISHIILFAFTYALNWIIIICIGKSKFNPKYIMIYVTQQISSYIRCQSPKLEIYISLNKVPTFKKVLSQIKIVSSLLFNVHYPTWRQVAQVLKSIFIFRTLTPNT